MRGPPRKKVPKSSWRLLVQTAERYPLLAVVCALAVSGAVLWLSYRLLARAPRTPGTFTIAPSTLHCNAPSSTFTLSIALPGTLLATQRLTWRLDGVKQAQPLVKDIFTLRESDNMWVYESTQTSTSNCELSRGLHVISITDEKDKLLAEGLYELKN